MLSSLYTMLTWCARPYFKRLLKKRLENGKEIADRLHERMGRPSKPRPQGKIIWIHGASVGESLSALPLVDRIIDHFPQCHVMVTTGTVTSAALMAKRLPPRAFHQFIPVDDPQWVRQFVEYWRPSAVLWLESDFWPNILKTVHEKDIPAILVNARMSPESYRKWTRYGRGFLKSVLANFDLCLAQNRFERDRLASFDAPEVKVSENLKYASPALPVNVATALELKEAIGTRPVWQFVSTHEGEEEIAFEIHRKLKKEFPDLLTIIVPRHPDRGVEISNIAAGFTVGRRRQDTIPHPDIEIYIADTMGELGTFFSLVPLVVMGGSFVPHGGHNPIEPAQFGSMIVYGPHMFNFKTICADFEDVKAALPVTENDLVDTIRQFLHKPAKMNPYRQAARELTRTKSDALDTVWDDLFPLLDRAYKTIQAD